MSAWAPRRVAVLALSASVVLAACSRPAPGEPQDRPPSPQAQVMPAPLAPAQVADSGKIEVDRLIDEGTRLEAGDKAASQAAWQGAYSQVLDDAAALFIADVKRVIVHRADLEGVVTDPAYDTVFFQFLHRVGP